MTRQLATLLSEQRGSSSARLRRPGQRHGGAVRAAARDRERAEQARALEVEFVRGTGCSSGPRRTPSGSWAASSMSPPTVSTGISPARSATRRRSSGRVARATAASSPTGTSRARFAAPPTRSSNSASGRATGWGSTWMAPEAAIAMLACARIGAVHSVVFGGFSAESVRDRRPTTPRPRSSLPPTAATAAARSSRSSG